MAGLLDFLNSPAGIGLLSAVAGGAAGARQGTPWNNAGRGALAGLQGYQGAQNQLKADAEDAVNRQFKQSQADKIQAEIARKNAMQTASAQAAQASFKQPVEAQYAVDGNAGNADFASMAADQNQFINDAQGSQLQEQPTQTRQAQAGGFDPAAYKQNMLTQLAQAGMPEEAVKFAPDTKPITLGKTLIDPTTGKVLATDQTWQEDQKTARSQRIDELKMRLEDQQLSREQNASLRREMADQQMALRRDLAAQSSADRRVMVSQGNKPPSGYRYTPNGDLEMIPGGPADTKKQMQLEGGSTVDTVAASLRDQYNKLEDGGGITSPKNRVGSNIAAGIGSSGVGQSLGRMFGTENQSSRNTIAQTRPILLQAIMKATGMSAKQMDSNAELKLYLATATDPTLDIASNRRALDMIEKLYGSGSTLPPKKPPQSPKDLPKKSSAGNVSKTINGKVYTQINGQWHEGQ